MSNKRNRRIVFSSGVGVFQRAAQLLTTLVTFPMMIKSLGLAGFGVWGAATSLAWVAGMLDLGFGGALVTLIPQALASGKPEVARRYVAAALFGLNGIVVAPLITMWPSDRLREGIIKRPERGRVPQRRLEVRGLGLARRSFSIRSVSPLSPALHGQILLGARGARQYILTALVV